MGSLPTSALLGQWLVVMAAAFLAEALPPRPDRSSTPPLVTERPFGYLFPTMVGIAFYLAVPIVVSILLALFDGRWTLTTGSLLLGAWAGATGLFAVLLAGDPEGLAYGPPDWAMAGGIAVSALVPLGAAIVLWRRR